MIVPANALKPDLLRALAEEYVSREGTDYGPRERSFESKVEDVLRGIESGKVVIVFDAETESCDLREADALLPKKARVT